MFWCSGSWNLRVDQLQNIRGTQYEMVRKMMHFKRLEGESTDDFFERTTGAIKHTLYINQFRTWDQIAHIEVHRWAGFLARLSTVEPDRFTSKAFVYKDWNWIQNTIASQNRGRQLHGKYLYTWRWERPIYNCYGTNWQSLAQDRTAWSHDEHRFLQHRLLNI